jgi:hypothetical protein
MPEPDTARRDRTAAGRAAMVRNAAQRRAADPAKLSKAVKTVIAGAPRLSAEQIAQIRALLPPASAAGDAPPAA